LPAPVRRDLEHGLGTTLGAVSLHTDTEAAAMSSSLGARAFTVGRDVYMGPGAYDPASVGGFRLLAHEMAHVLQAPPTPALSPLTVSSPIDRDERDAERAADQATQRRLTGSGPAPIVSSHAASGPSLHRGELEGDKAADVDTQPVQPTHRNQRIATWLGAHDSAIGTRAVVGEETLASYPAVGGIPYAIWRPGWTPGQYDSEAAAAAAIKASGTIGAVFLESGKYVAYHATSYAVWYDFTWPNVRWFADKPWTAVEFDEGNKPVTVVTQDGVSITADHFKTKDEAKTLVSDESLMPGAGADPFVGYRAAFKDLNKPGILELVVGPALRDFTLALLHRSRSEAERQIVRYSSSGIVSPREIAQMQAVATELARLDGEMDKIPKITPYTPEEVAEQAENVGKFRALQDQRRQKLTEYPALAHVDAREFVALTPEQQFDRLAGAMGKVVRDIDATRDNVLDGTLNLWKIPKLLDAVTAGLGITDPALRARVKEIASASESTPEEAILTIITVALGLASVFVDGPLGIAIAAGALGLSVSDAVKQTQEILAEHAATNTAAHGEGLLSPDEARSYGWLVLAWGGVIADAAQLASAIKAVSAAGGALESGVQALAKGDEEVAKRLRLASGIGDATEVVSEASRPGLARRLGTTLEVDGTLGKEVHVVYHVDARGRVVLDGVRCGPEATAGVILAHEGTVRLLTRYDGVLGRIRELVDRVLSIGPARFPPGSQAFESFLEVQKLPEVIASRQKALGAVLGTESEAVLRRDIAFLENELLRHEQVVEKVVLEEGVGYVARAGESTKKAVAEGMPDLAASPLVKDPSLYYYRSVPGKVPPYVLVRFESAAAPPLAVVKKADDTYEIIAAAEAVLTRTEEAAAIVTGWKKGFQDAFAAVKGGFTQGVFKVVPLKGVAATGKKIKDLMTVSQQQELYAILLKAFAKDADPAARATTAMTRLIEHDITLVQGTNQLRAYSYRLSFAKGLTQGAEIEGDLHHLIPLYLGGDHRILVDVGEELHQSLHRLIDQIPISEGVTLAPGSVGRSGFAFQEGAAVLYSDGRVQLVRLGEDATYAVVP
jgi:hypothetical protein